MKKTVFIFILLNIYIALDAQWTTVDVGNSSELTLFKHTGTSSPVPFNLQKLGYSYSSISYGILHLDMGHNEIGGGSNLHFRLQNSSDDFKEYGGFGSYIIDNTTGSEDGGLTFYTTNGGQTRIRRMTILNNGRFGLGTTNPSELLEIESSNPVISVRHTGDGTSAYGWIEFNDTNSRMGYVGFGSNNNNHLYIYNQAGGNIAIPEGNLGLGTTSTGSHKLAVEGSIGARSIKVEATGWSDFVFDDNYELISLEELEDHIKNNKHLPDIPSESEVIADGINLGEMNAKLLQKIEELTLYLIEQNKRVKQLEKEVSQLKDNK